MKIIRFLYGGFIDSAAACKDPEKDERCNSVIALTSKSRSNFGNSPAWMTLVTTG